jgi:hypothetical protein
LRIGDIGHPVASTDIKRALLEISYFAGLGALIVFLAGGILARVSARLARDVEAAPVPASDVAPAEPAYEPAAPMVSPDAVTQERANQATVAEEEPHKSRRGLFRRRHANV